MTSKARKEWQDQRAAEEPARRAGHIPECPWPSDMMLSLRFARAAARHPRMVDRILGRVPRARFAPCHAS